MLQEDKSAGGNVTRDNLGDELYSVSLFACLPMWGIEKCHLLGRNFDSLCIICQCSHHSRILQRNVRLFGLNIL